jgi:hypothetical protein
LLFSKKITSPRKFYNEIAGVKLAFETSDTVRPRGGDVPSVGQNDQHNNKKKTCVRNFDQKSDPKSDSTRPKIKCETPKILK